MKKIIRKKILEISDEIKKAESLKVIRNKIGGNPLPEEEIKDEIDKLFVRGGFKKCFFSDCDNDGVWQFLNKKNKLEGFYCEKHKYVGHGLKFNPRAGTKEYWLLRIMLEKLEIYKMFEKELKNCSQIHGSGKLGGNK